MMYFAVVVACVASVSGVGDLYFLFFCARPILARPKKEFAPTVVENSVVS